MRILVLSSKMVWPLWGGGEIRNFNLLKETAKHHDVYFLSFLRSARDRDHFSALEPLCKKAYGIELNRGSVKKLYDAARSWVDSKPFPLLQYTMDEMASTLSRIVAAEKIDLVHAHFLHVGQYAENKNGAAFVYDAHNLEHVLWSRLRETHSNPLMRRFCQVQSDKFIDWQRIVADQSEKIVTLSDDDGEEYRRISPSADVTTVPNGADIDFFQPRPGEVEQNSLLYFGNFEWQPQEDAVLYFCREILPLIRRKIPAVKLYIVGRGPSQAVRALNTENVIVTGFVDDIRDYIARAAVVVLPLRVGAGTKHRVFQTLAMKRPLVTSSVGAEGIRLEQGRNAMIADDPAEFADRAVELLENDRLRVSMGEHGRELVEEQYNWRHSYEILEAVFQEAIQRK